MPLFARVKGRVSLTDAGRRIAPLVAGCLRDAGAMPFPGSSPRIRPCSRSAPRRRWRRPGWRRGSAISRSAIPISPCGCRTDNRLVDFSTGEFHAAIRVGRGDWPGLKCHFLFRTLFQPDLQRRIRGRAPARPARAIARRAAAQPARRLVAGLDARKRASTVPRRAPRSRPRPRQPGDGGQCRLLRRRHRDDDADVLAGRAKPLGGSSSRSTAVHITSRSHWLVYPEGRRNQPKIAAFRDWMLAEAATIAETEPAAIFQAARRGQSHDCPLFGGGCGEALAGRGSGRLRGVPDSAQPHPAPSRAREGRRSGCRGRVRRRARRRSAVEPPARKPRRPASRPVSSQGETTERG